MKLRTKLTISYILLVIVVVALSHVLIYNQTRVEFARFIDRKSVEMHKASLDSLKNSIIRDENKKIQIQQPKDKMFKPDINIKERLKNLKEQSPEFKFLKATTDSLLLVGIIGIGLAIILAYFLGKFLVRRIAYLKDVIVTYENTGKVKHVPEDGDDEIAELSKVYNHLVEKIEEQDGIRKEFFTDMSHELRTPLTSVKGYLEGLLDGVFDPKKEIFEKALGETDRMIYLIREMSGLAKMEAEDVKLNKREVNMRELVAQVSAVLQEQAKRNSMDIMIEGEVIHSVDIHKFKQVVINLLSNAISYAIKGTSIFVHVSKESTKFKLSIKNKTENINEEEIKNFFDRFYRADKSRARIGNESHLGIGLNIVRKIVTAHGGTIDVKCEGGEIEFVVVV